MGSTIDYISINDAFWLQFKEHLISFGFKGLPKDTHFTIVFDDKNPDINFHITRNSGVPANKPQIKIVLIDKKLLEEVIPSLMISLLNMLLQPLDIGELKNKYDYDLGFISFNSLEHSASYLLMENTLFDSFKDFSELKKKNRLKIKGDIEKPLETFTTSEVLQKSLIENMVELSTEFLKPVDGGMIISEDNMIQVIKINDKWFTIRNDLKPFDLLAAFVNPVLAKHLIWKTKRALVSIQKAETYSETAHLNKPIRLVQIIETTNANE